MKWKTFFLMFYDVGVNFLKNETRFLMFNRFKPETETESDILTFSLRFTFYHIKHNNEKPQFITLKWFHIQVDFNW
jgi:hypothetical protein